MVAGLKAERARKAVAEVGRARTRALIVRGADIAAVEERRESGEAVVVVVWRRRVQYAGDVAVVPRKQSFPLPSTNQRWQSSRWMTERFEANDALGTYFGRC